MLIDDSLVINLEEWWSANSCNPTAKRLRDIVHKLEVTDVADSPMLLAEYQDCIDKMRREKLAMMLH